MENIEERSARQVEQAYKSWQQAIHIFNNAVTKEDIDFAVYNLEAKRKQYLRVLKTVRCRLEGKEELPREEENAPAEAREEDFR